MKEKGKSLSGRKSWEEVWEQLGQKGIGGSHVQIRKMQFLFRLDCKIKNKKKGGCVLVGIFCFLPQCLLGGFVFVFYLQRIFLIFG